MKRLGVFLLPLDGMLVHRRSLPRNLLGFPQQFIGTHLYSWVERGTVRVKNTIQWPLARVRTRTARSRDERTNHEATAPPDVNKDREILPRNFTEQKWRYRSANLDKEWVTHARCFLRAQSSLRACCLHCFVVFISHACAITTLACTRHKTLWSHLKGEWLFVQNYASDIFRKSK